MGNSCSTPKQVPKCHTAAYCVSSLPEGPEKEAADHLCDIFCTSESDCLRAVDSAIARRRPTTVATPVVYGDSQHHRDVCELFCRLCRRAYRCSDQLCARGNRKSSTADIVIDLLVQLRWNFGWNVSGPSQLKDQDILSSLLRTNSNPSKSHFSVLEWQLILRREELGIVFRPFHLYLILAGSFKHDDMIREILPFVPASVLYEKDRDWHSIDFCGIAESLWNPFLIWNVARIQLLWIERLIAGHFNGYVAKFESDPCAPLFEGQVAHASEPLLFGHDGYDWLDSHSPDSRGPRVVLYKTLLRERVLKCKTARAEYIQNARKRVATTLFGLAGLSALAGLAKLVVDYLPQDIELEDEDDSSPTTPETQD